MTHYEILKLRLKIETDPILTDEEIEFIWDAMDRQHPIKVFTDRDFLLCGDCGSCVAKFDEYCWHCGQKLYWEGYDES